MPSRAQSLVAARVPGGINFDAGQPLQSSALAFYRHPADKNTASVAVLAGRALDITA
jgi:hypothetical protein